MWNNPNSRLPVIRFAMASSPVHAASPQQLGSPVSPDVKDFSVPAGWQKKIASTKGGGTPRRGAVCFVAPTGEEIKSKRSLEGYLKSHPGGPALTEFDWSTGETPRRSSRLGMKADSLLDSPGSGSGRKRARRKVLVEDEAPLDNKRVELEGAPPAKADEVMEVEKVEEAKDVEKMESDINETVEKIEFNTNQAVEKMGSDTNEVAEKINEATIAECVAEAETEKTDELKTIPEVGMEVKVEEPVVHKGKGPEEELAKQEQGMEQREESKPEQLGMVSEENAIGEVSESGATPEGEQKQEDGGNLSSRIFSEQPEASNASVL